MSASDLRQTAGALWSAALAAIPAALSARLSTSGAALEIGCGRGLSCLALADAFPSARVVGHDTAGPSIAQATALAANAGLAPRLLFETTDSTRLSHAAFDLVVVRSVLTRPDPRRLLNAIRNALVPDGSCLVIETAGAASTLKTLARGAGFSRFRVDANDSRFQLAELGR